MLINPPMARTGTGMSNSDNAPTITYAQDSDPWLKRWIINAIEVLSGRHLLTDIYAQLKKEPFQIPHFFTRGLQLGHVTMIYNRFDERKIPKAGPVVFIANHPNGIIDGVIMCEIASRTRGNFKILLNHRLCQDENLNKLFLPVSFEGTREATKLNIRTKRAAEQLLKDGGTLVIFPAGGVSTRSKFGFGELEELPWTTFAAKVIRSSRATVVPVFFHGENSRLFHFISGFLMTLRLALYIHEVTRRMHTAFRLTLGEPIPFEDLEGLEHRQALTDHLKDRVESLANETSKLPTSLHPLISGT